MSKLQYIKLFEAFESIKLTKTLGYIKDKKDRDTFLDIIKRICNSIDFPFSKLSDEFFDYLPFKKALEKSSIITDEPCEATSEESFRGFVVKGEKCTNGKIKRKWGAGTRDVVCPVCSGTGFKPKQSELKLIKFWFTSEGKYVTNTAVDGVIRTKFKEGTFSKKFSDYDIVRTIPENDGLSSLNMGDIVLLEIQGQDTVSFIWKEGPRYYAIQDEHDGGEPNDTKWRKIARNSWSLGHGEYKNVRVLKLKEEKKETKFVVNPYEWNVGLSFNWNGMSINRNRDIKNDIKDAHFAIIMDFGKIKKSGFMKKYDLITQRSDTKRGSKLDPEQSDKEIKKRNIERYMNELSKRLDISSDISNCNKLISKTLGYKNALYTILPTNVSNEFSSIIDYYLKIMSVAADDDKEYYVDRMKNKVLELFKFNRSRNVKVISGLNGLRKRLVEFDDDQKLHIQFLDKFNELSAVFYKKISNYNIESIEDFEVVNQKITSVKNILKSERYGLNRFCSYVIEYLNRDDNGERSFRYMIDSYYFNPEQALQSLERVSKIIEKI